MFFLDSEVTSPLSLSQVAIRIIQILFPRGDLVKCLYRSVTTFSVCRILALDLSLTLSLHYCLTWNKSFHISVSVPTHKIAIVLLFN